MILGLGYTWTARVPFFGFVNLGTLPSADLQTR